MPINCPSCGHAFEIARQEAGRRICIDCGMGVKLTHKWKIGSDGRIHHRDCKNPTRKRKSEATGLFE